MPSLHTLRLRVRNFLGHTRDFGILGAIDAVRGRDQPWASIRLRGISTPVRYRPGTSDFQAIRQIFGRAESFVPLPLPPRFIVDAGANIGCTSLLYANRWPDAAILAIEPDPDNFRLLSQNLDAYPNVTVLRGALWSRDGTLRIQNPNDASWAIRVGDNGEGDVVDAYTLQTLMQRSGRLEIDVLKLDVEGAEREILSQGSDRWIDQVKMMLVELHDRIEPGCSAALSSAIGQRPHQRFRNGEYDVIIFESTSSS